MVCYVVVMKELLDISLLPYMLPVSGLLALVVIFLILSIVTGIGEGFDFTIEADVDAEVHGAGGNVLDAFLNLVNAKKVPTMFVLGVLALATWVLGVGLTVIFNTGHSNLIGIVILLVSFVVSVIVTRYSVMPLIPLFRLLHKGEDNGEKPVGKQAFVKSSELTESNGVVEYKGAEGVTQLNARLREGGAVLTKGESVVILERSKNNKFYYVAKLKI